MFPLSHIANSSIGSYNLLDAIKDISDAMTFDWDQTTLELKGIGLKPMAGVTWENFSKFREMAITNLYGRLFSTEEKVNYVAGGFPLQLLNNMQAVVNGKDEPYFNAYHGHRESLYALAKFFGIDFNIVWPGLPRRAIPAGTTIFWELYKNKDAGNGQDAFFVRTFFWTPSFEIGENKDSSAMHPVTLQMCGGLADCPFSRFEDWILDRLSLFGSWQTLCGKEPKINPANPSKFMPDTIKETAVTGAGDAGSAKVEHVTLSSSSSKHEKAAAPVQAIDAANFQATPLQSSSLWFWLGAACVPLVGGALFFKNQQQKKGHYDQIADLSENSKRVF
jgi:hypothetical protein